MRKYAFLLVLSIITLSNANSQNVGIGTNTPSAKLDVNGNLRIRTIPQGAVADSYLTVDADGNIKKLPAPMLAFAVITRWGGDQTQIGEPETLYQFSDPDPENPDQYYGLINEIPGAIISREYIPGAEEKCIGIRVPGGTYQLTITYTGVIPYCYDPEAICHNPNVFDFFYSVPSGTSVFGGNEYNRIFNTVPVQWGRFRGSISEMCWVSLEETGFFPLNLGWGINDLTYVGHEITLQSMQLSLVKLR